MASSRNWEEYNEALVKRGSILLDLDFVADWSRELKTMNERKEGARFRYPESFIKLLAVVHAYVLPYRQLEGFTRALSQHVDGLKAPDYTTIWWRVARMKVDLVSSVELDKDVTIAVDSSGIKVSNRGEWMRKKWKVKRGFIKVHIAVDTRTKQILSMEVTRENVSDGRMLKPLVEDSAGKTDLKRVVADGAYDSKSNFRLLADRGIEPVIRVRKNASFKAGDLFATSNHAWCCFTCHQAAEKALKAILEHFGSPTACYNLIALATEASKFIQIPKEAEVACAFFNTYAR
jgi:IS5 family transposase